MNKAFAAAGVVLSLSALAGAAQARSWPTMEEVVASAGAGRVVTVECDNTMWPTIRQVARHADTSTEAATTLRRHIVASGRHACAAGATHVVVAFEATPASVARAVPAPRPANPR